MSDQAHDPKVRIAKTPGVFHKSSTCPSAEELLLHHKRQQLLRIQEHLASCDFCNAELQLLMRFPSTGEISSLPDIPTSLRMLAERLLKCGVPPNHHAETFGA